MNFLPVVEKTQTEESPKSTRHILHAKAEAMAAVGTAQFHDEFTGQQRVTLGLTEYFTY